MNETPTTDPATDIRWDWRFERGLRLFGPEGMEKLAAARVAVFGLGGVGSYAVEGLARSGVGHLVLVDFDRVCVTNVNRQIHALTATIGQSKAALMGSRVRDINPGADVRLFEEFYDRSTSDRLLDPRPDVVLDCIDNVTAKMHLVATCVSRSIPIVTALGSGAKFDPTRIRTVPLPETHTDPLGRALRKHIRRKHAVPDEQLARVVAVFSDEPVVAPHTGHGRPACTCPAHDGARRALRHPQVIHGTAAFVTAAFGMAAASAAVRLLLGRDPFSRVVVCEFCGKVADPTRPTRTKPKPAPGRAGGD